MEVGSDLGRRLGYGARLFRAYADMKDKWDSPLPTGVLWTLCLRFLERIEYRASEAGLLAPEAWGHRSYSHFLLDLLAGRLLAALDRLDTAVHAFAQSIPERRDQVNEIRAALPSMDPPDIGAEVAGH